MDGEEGGLPNISRVKKRREHFVSKKDKTTHGGVLWFLEP